MEGEQEREREEVSRKRVSRERERRKREVCLVGRERIRNVCTIISALPSQARAVPSRAFLSATYPTAYLPRLD